MSHATRRKLPHWGRRKLIAKNNSWILISVGDVRSVGQSAQTAELEAHTDCDLEVGTAGEEPSISWRTPIRPRTATTIVVTARTTVTRSLVRSYHATSGLGDWPAPAGLPIPSSVRIGRHLRAKLLGICVLFGLKPLRTRPVVESRRWRRRSAIPAKAQSYARW
jgi:hypothetical protein